MGLRSQPPDPAPGPLHSASRLDALLLLMTVIWGTNYALIKSAFSELDPQAFNALRLLLASAVMVGVSRFVRRGPVFYTPEPVTREDWIRPHSRPRTRPYQYLFVGGLRDRVANGALLVSASPV